MEETTKQLRERFLLLSCLTATQTENAPTVEALPPFFGFLLAVLETPPDLPLCFVLPRCGDVARLASVLRALAGFRQRHELAVKILAAQKFKKGQAVQVFPSGEVFIYEGIRDDDPNRFWLSELDLFRPQRGAYRTKFPVKMSFPLSAVQRLAATTKKRPKGNLRERAGSLLQPPKAAVDQLLDTVAFGNFSGAANEVILLDSHSGFADFSKRVAFQIQPQAAGALPLRELLPFGDLIQPSAPGKSWLRKWDDANPVGEPLVAITHSAELLANFSLDAATTADSESRSKLIVANGLSRFKHRQTYDDIAGSQKLVLFASLDEQEMIETLGRAPIPCKFWWLSAAEIGAATGLIGANGSPGVVGRVLRWAKNHELMMLESVSCEHQELESVCLGLEDLRGRLSNDGNDPLTKLTALAWRMVNDIAAIVRPVTVLEQRKFATQISHLRSEAKNNVWLRPECASILNDIANGIEACLPAERKLGLSKGAALYRVVRESQAAQLKCALLVRNENQIADLKLWLRQRNISIETYSPRTLPADSAFDRLICVAWPGWHSLKQIAGALVAPRITVLAYPFEGRWLNQCKRRLHQRPDVPTVTAVEKSKLVLNGKATPAIWVEEKKEETPPAPPASTDTGIWDFEQRLRAVRKGSAALPVVAPDTVPARYVSFVGDHYAFLTQSHKLPVATALVSGAVRANQKLPERTVLEIRPGDFIVFPESGDREFVQMVADRAIGVIAPQLRKLARRWKDALQKSGVTPGQFHQQAKSLNRPRHLATIRYWFADSSQIGPREKDDLILIALVTGDKEFEAEIDDVRLAIERLWSAHLSAGMRLHDALLQRLPHVMGQVEENGTEVDLGELGSAWIVQVDSVASEDEPRSRNETNRLLRERVSTNPLLPI